MNTCVDRYSIPSLSRVMTGLLRLLPLMEFALFTLFACSLASVIATVFRGNY